MGDALEDVRRHSCCPTCHALFRTRPPRCPLDGTPLVEAGVDPMIGTIIAGTYQVEDVIGEGGIGRVYRARHVRISRKYALKVPFGELAFDPAIRRRLANEAEAASRVSHPNLVGVVDVGETQAGLFYLAMDLVVGSSLSSILAGGALAPGRALTLIAQIADGLGHAHARELVHRDLKPDNVIVALDDDGREAARIVDFGIALVQDEAHRRLTAEGMVIGTPEYMAPEQLTGAPIDARTDLFALGLVLYELVAGVTPFEGSSLEIATKNLTAALPAMSSRSLAGPVDPRIEALVRWMTHKEPGKRPARAELVAEEARRIAADLPGGRPAPPSRRRPVTFNPLAADGTPARSSPTAEAWSPIVVPGSGRISAGAGRGSSGSGAGAAAGRVSSGAGAVRVSPTPPAGLGNSATIKTPSVPMPIAGPLRSPTGSAPPPIAGQLAEVPEDDWPPLTPTPPLPAAPPPAPHARPAAPILSTQELSQLDMLPLERPVPLWKQPRVVLAAGLTAAVAAAITLLSVC